MNRIDPVAAASVVAATTGFLTVVCFCCGARGAEPLPGALLGLRVELASARSLVVKGEPIELIIEVRNVGSTTIVTTEPTVSCKTVRLETSREGKFVPPNVKWDGPPTDVTVKLAPGEAVKTQFDLGWLYQGVFLDAGVYVVQARYHPNGEQAFIANPQGGSCRTRSRLR